MMFKDQLVSFLVVKKCEFNNVGNVKELRNVWNKKEIVLLFSVREVIWKQCFKWIRVG